MTNKDYTALVFVVDRSGSMLGIARDMEGGISALVDEQAALPGKLTIDFTLFDDQYEDFYEFASPDDDLDFSIPARGMTALYDAVGKKITKFGAALKALPEDERPGTVIFAIVTDGMENASQEFRAKDVKALIKEQTDKYGWTFSYLGANQDAVFVAQGIGISAGNALTYNTANVRGMTQTFNNYTTSLRTNSVASYSDADRANNA